MLAVLGSGEERESFAEGSADAQAGHSHGFAWGMETPPVGEERRALTWGTQEKKERGLSTEVKEPKSCSRY